MEGVEGVSTTATVAQKRTGDALGVAAQAMREHVAGITADIDAAHRDGLAIPPYVAHAVEVLGALASAWTYNSLGQPAPRAVKSALGLLDGEGVTE